jgi:HlyD family secretion protein
MCALHAARFAARPFLLILIAIILKPLPLAADEPKAGQVVLESKGYLVPSRLVSISPNVAGHVVELRLEEGTQVKRGDVMARLDSREFEAARRLAVAELNMAQAALARMAGEPKAEAAIAQAKVERAQAQLTIAQLRLEGTIVHAPFDGTVLAKRVDIGSLVDPKAFQVPASICDLADLRQMEVEVWVQERDLPIVAIGQTCSIRPDAFANDIRQGRVIRMLPVADRAKNAVAVRVQLEMPERGQQLRPESAAVVQFLKK